MEKIILASRSPRRKELLSKIVPQFEIMESGFDENKIQEENPEKLAKLLSYEKAKAVFRSFTEKNILVIGADTVVVSPNGKIFGIPKDNQEALEMLSELSGNTHTVITGVTLMGNHKEEIFSVATKVFFYELDAEEMESYIASEEPFDKAGGYGIQGQAALFVKKIDGDYYNVVGLPISRLYHRIKNFF